MKRILPVALLVVACATVPNEPKDQVTTQAHPDFAKWRPVAIAVMPVEAPAHQLRKEVRQAGIHPDGVTRLRLKRQGRAAMLRATGTRMTVLPAVALRGDRDPVGIAVLLGDKIVLLGAMIVVPGVRSTGFGATTRSNRSPGLKTSESREICTRKASPGARSASKRFFSPSKSTC